MEKLDCLTAQMRRQIHSCCKSAELCWCRASCSVLCRQEVQLCFSVWFSGTVRMSSSGECGLQLRSWRGKTCKTEIQSDLSVALTFDACVFTTKDQNKSCVGSHVLHEFILYSFARHIRSCMTSNSLCAVDQHSTRITNLLECLSLLVEKSLLFPSQMILLFFNGVHSNTYWQ